MRNRVIGLFCAAFATLSFAFNAEAAPTYTILSAGTAIYGINANGAVAGIQNGSGFLRTPDGTITTFDAPGAKHGTLARAININDAIAGTYQDANGASHGFVRNPDGTITAFDAPGASLNYSEGTFPVDINGSGTVTGFYYDDQNRMHGFVRTTDGTITAIDIGNAALTEAQSINSKGAIAGGYADGGGYHGFLRSPSGEITTFDLPVSRAGPLGASINNAGTVVGEYSDGSYYRSFIRAVDGTITLFDKQGYNTGAYDMNAKGLVVGGCSAYGKTKSAGFIRYPNGALKLFRAPGANFATGPTGINTDGTIVGYFYTRYKNVVTSYGFIRTP